jgi:hypothetical protein
MFATLAARSAAVLLAGIVVGAALLTAGCGGSSGDATSAGDIPDNQVYVPFTPQAGGFTVSVPQGWARSDSDATTVFTDKLNSVRIEAVPRAAAPTVDSARAEEVPALAATAPDSVAGDVTVVQRHAGPAVLVTYQASSPPSSVTGKTSTNAVERYEFWRDGREVVLTLSGPQGADNVDPWRQVTDSLYRR